MCIRVIKTNGHSLTGIIGEDQLQGVVIFFTGVVGINYDTHLLNCVDFVYQDVIKEHLM